jgi:hypothetical protein
MCLQPVLEQNTFRSDPLVLRASAGLDFDYSRTMARGWESKSIEAQQEEASRSRAKGPALTEAQRVAAERRRTLQLTRTRAEADLARATAPAHRRMLEQALEAIDQQIASLE